MAGLEAKVTSKLIQQNIFGDNIPGEMEVNGHEGFTINSGFAAHWRTVRIFILRANEFDISEHQLRHNPRRQKAHGIGSPASRFVGQFVGQL
jgi:hypothetical protein